VAPVTSSALFKARTECSRLNSGVVGFSPTRDVDACPHFFLSFPIYAKAFRWADPPIQGALPDVCNYSFFIALQPLWTLAAYSVS
jgi:hypothetical protein